MTTSQDQHLPRLRRVEEGPVPDLLQMLRAGSVRGEPPLRGVRDVLPVPHRGMRTNQREEVCAPADRKDKERRNPPVLNWG